jgi:MinD-like ATPase involved in chromosome partitioning or flagellar assembly
LAVWSGSSGGTGKSTLAAEVAALAAPRMRALLVGLNEPGGVISGLGAVPRPDLLDGEYQRRGELFLLPGPSLPARVREMAGALPGALEAAAASFDLVVLDLPPALVCPATDAALALAGAVLYVMRPTAQDGDVALRALGMLNGQKLFIVWNQVRSDDDVTDVARAARDAAVAFPDAVGMVPFDAGVMGARERRQLLFEAVSDGVIRARTAASTVEIAERIFGWETEPEKGFRWGNFKVKVVP